MKKLILPWVTTLYILFFNIPLNNQAQTLWLEGHASQSLLNGTYLQADVNVSLASTLRPFNKAQYQESATGLLAETNSPLPLQNGCDESMPSEIVGSFEDPCSGTVVTYSVTANSDFTSYEWEMPRATTGDMNVDWIILSGQGTNSIRVKTGEKNGTLKLTVNHKECGIKIRTVPVVPKNGCNKTCEMPVPQLEGPEVVCYIYDGGPESGPFTPYIYYVTNPVIGAVYDFILPEGFIQVGGEPGEPLIEVLTVFDLSTEDVNPSMPGVQQEIGVVYSIPGQACTSEVSSLFVTLSEENCEPGELLPVELVSFKGVSRNGAVEVNWSTATEKNNDRFEVQRSSNGKDFSTIGEVKGAGNSSVLQHYRFIDKLALAGTSYYRLNQIDFDLAHEYSKVIAVQHLGVTDQDMQVKLYPNPVTEGAFTIRFDQLPKAGGDISLAVLDVNGKLIYSTIISANTQELTMPLQSLGMRQGLYMISLTSGTESQVQRILVQ